MAVLVQKSISPLYVALGVTTKRKKIWDMDPLSHAVAWLPKRNFHFGHPSQNVLHLPLIPNDSLGTVSPNIWACAHIHLLETVNTVRLQHGNFTQKLTRRSCWNPAPRSEHQETMASSGKTPQTYNVSSVCFHHRETSRGWWTWNHPCGTWH